MGLLDSQSPTQLALPLACDIAATSEWLVTGSWALVKILGIDVEDWYVSGRYYYTLKKKKKVL